MIEKINEILNSNKFNYIFLTVMFFITAIQYFTINDKDLQIQYSIESSIFIVGVILLSAIDKLTIQKELNNESDSI